MTESLRNLDQQALTAMEQALTKEFSLLSGNAMALDLSRGKPAADQLSLSEPMEDMLNGDYRSADGTDLRNYGGARGIPEARELGAQLLGVPAEFVVAGGNSSLNLMYLVVNLALQQGLWGDNRRWSNVDTPTLLTPVPGYDRHFALTAALNIKMHNIPMLKDGPDIDACLRTARENPEIKGIWCVPKYSNPTGNTYTEATVDALARLPKEAAADDFVVLWDNAYAVHHLNNEGEALASIFDAAQHHGTEAHVVQFASTSKITFAGAGVAFIASAERVLANIVSHLSFMTIGPDKVNQLRHARFLNGRLREHMQDHAALLRPKFDIVQRRLEEDLGGLGIAEWTNPVGGYFVSLDVLDGLASEIVQLAKQVGLTLTPAGATYPHGNDPQDRNVRIAPTFAELEDLEAAMHVLTLCVKLASTRKLIAEKMHG